MKIRNLLHGLALLPTLLFSAYTPLLAQTSDPVKYVSSLVLYEPELEIETLIVVHNPFDDRSLNVTLTWRNHAGRGMQTDRVLLGPLDAAMLKQTVPGYMTLHTIALKIGSSRFDLQPIAVSGLIFSRTAATTVTFQEFTFQEF